VKNSAKKCEAGFLCVSFLKPSYQQDVQPGQTRRARLLVQTCSPCCFCWPRLGSWASTWLAQMTFILIYAIGGWFGFDAAGRLHWPVFHGTCRVFGGGCLHPSGADGQRRRGPFLLALLCSGAPVRRPLVWWWACLPCASRAFTSALPRLSFGFIVEEVFARWEKCDRRQLPASKVWARHRPVRLFFRHAAIRFYYLCLAVTVAVPPWASSMCCAPVHRPRICRHPRL
jgi:hypothetical protein